MALAEISRTLSSTATNKLTILIMTGANWTTEGVTGSAHSTASKANWNILGTYEGDTVEGILTPNEAFVDDLGLIKRTWDASIKGKIRSPFTLANLVELNDNDPIVVMLVDTEDLVALTGYTDSLTDLTSVTAGTFTVKRAYSNLEIIPTDTIKGGESANQDLEFKSRLPLTALAESTKTTSSGVWSDVEVTIGT
jgi:hypothetical protein